MQEADVTPIFSRLPLNAQRVIHTNPLFDEINVVFPPLNLSPLTDVLRIRFQTSLCLNVQSQLCGKDTAPPPVMMTGGSWLYVVGTRREDTVTRRRLYPNSHQDQSAKKRESSGVRNRVFIFALLIAWLTETWKQGMRFVVFVRFFLQLCCIVISKAVQGSTQNYESLAGKGVDVL